MAEIVKARAFCNDEVAYLAWETDGKIIGSLGFMITRIFVDSGERRVLPTWVAFKSQSNPDWEEQDTSVWPIQKFSWRDLTLRKSRNTLATRTGPLRVKYEIQPVGPLKAGLKPVPKTDTAQPGKYSGNLAPRWLGSASGRSMIHCVAIWRVTFCPCCASSSIAPKLKTGRSLPRCTN